MGDGEGLSATQSRELEQAFALFDSNQSGSIDMGELQELLLACGEQAADDQVEEMLDRLDENNTGKIEFAEFKTLFSEIKGKEEEGRHYALLSLAEAASLRKVMHYYPGLLPGICLRTLWGSQLDAVNELPQSSPHQLGLATQSWRFYNNEVHFQPAEIAKAVEALSGSAPAVRRAFFVTLLRARRRENKTWENTPVAKLVTLKDEIRLLNYRARLSRVRAAIQHQVGSLLAAFRVYDTNHNGWLNQGELMAALLSMKLDVKPSDLAELFIYGDTDKNSLFSFEEFSRLLELNIPDNIKARK
jgi:Ca2+-binding EF-hand superfamily protein